MAELIGFVYFIRSGLRGPIKIGNALNPIGRLVDLQIGNPEKLYLLGCIPGDIRVEAAILEDLRAYNLRGEWHKPERAVVAYISDALEAEGVKKDVLFKLFRDWYGAKRFDADRAQAELSALMRPPRVARVS